MQVKFTPNIQFTSLVKANGRQREFNFRKHNGIQEEVFTVDVSDDRGNRIIFQMHKEDKAWKIIPQALPPWIPEVESKLNSLIEEELQKSSPQ